MSEDESPSTPRRRRRWRKKLAVLVLVVLGVVGLDHWLPHMLLDHYKFAVDANPELLAQYGADHEAVTFTTSDGVDIAGWYVPAPKGSVESPTLVVLHTLGRTREDMLPLVLPVWRDGAALLLIDMRGHGESGSRHFTYGYHEWRDVTAAIDYLASRGDGSERKVVLLGASAGGAVAVAAAARDERVSALVAIGSFADLRQIVAHQAWWLPGFWVQRAVRKAERIADFEASEVSPARDITRVTCPILIVHGDADTYVPFADARLLHDVARAPKELYPIAGATHATMFGQGGTELADRIAAFISRGAPEREMP